ncbi:aminopeptidase N [Coralliovum pocilloporae]|uniref:aminopeptidase N n=1 Tax=Coralliovum pocilloporae TaxID=3066369 RepID=UPI00330725C0
MRTETPVVIRLDDYTPSTYSIETVSLDIKLHPTETLITSTITLRKREGTGTETAALVLDGDDLDFVSADLDGAALADDAYTVSRDQFVLLAPPEGLFTLTLTTKVDPTANTRLMGLYRSSGTYCTQCEAEGFRRITYFLDRPDVLAVYTTRLEANKAEAPILLGNGNLQDSGTIEGTDRHFTVWHDPHPKPSYLFALVGGDLASIHDSFTTSSGKPVELGIYVEHGKEHLCAYAMDALKRSMKWDEDAFGLEYDLDVFNIVAVSDFNMGAMENKGLNIFNDKYVLANPETATDQDYANIEAVIAHEYFHNWTGNRITCRDWFQLCLKEGLTVFRDQEFSSDMRSRAVKRISDVRLLKSHQFPEDGGPLAHPVRPESYTEINNFYTATVYEKGSELCRMLKTILGDDGFRAGMDLYFDRHDGDATTIESFLACFAEATGQDLDQFKLWYSQAGTPELIVSTDWDFSSGLFGITIEQSCPPTPGQPVKQPLHIPVRLGLLNEHGADMPISALIHEGGDHLQGDVLHMRQGRHRVVFGPMETPPVLSLLRGFSAPVNLTLQTDNDSRLHLMASDSDGFNRWQAAQDLATRHLIDGARGTLSVDPRFLSALLSIIRDDSLEPAFRAQVLTLPSEADIAREIGKDVDPDAIHTARKALKVKAAETLGPDLPSLYRALEGSGAYSPDAAEAGRRSLRNAVLDLMLASGSDEAYALAHSQYETANNMTDRFAALSTLVMAGAETADAVLDDFHERYQHHALVIDKWLSVQAMAPQSDTLGKVIDLTRHSSFSMSNPNRVRSLIGAFATGNPTQFHRADGAGYAFVADHVITLDDSNPQVASRLLTSFRSWRAMTEDRQHHAREALQRILDKDSLSKDVRDIAERSLA